jgi:hypothetical protein
MMKIPLIAVLLPLLSACATQVVPTQEASPVPIARILWHNLFLPANGSASLIVKRDVGFDGMNCNFRLFLDGRPFADIATGEKTQIYVSPGEHILRVIPGLCLNGTAKTSVTIAAGQTRTYRVGIGSGGETRLQPTAF